MSGTILVLGATGTVGRPLVADLVSRGERVRAASRQGAPLPGAEGARFDYESADLLDAAMEGVDRLWALVPAGQLDSARLFGPVIDRAAAQGAKVVMMTAMGVDADESIPYRQAERRLEASGAPFVILRPNWFMDNFASYWAHGIAQGEIALPAGEGRTSLVDARDIAAAAAGALTSARFDGEAIEITGPEALSYAEAAAILSEAAGRPIAYRPTDDAEFVAMLTGAGLASDYAHMLAAIMGPVRLGYAAKVTDGVDRLAGRPPRTLRAWAEERRAALARTA